MATWFSHPFPDGKATGRLLPTALGPHPHPKPAAQGAPEGLRGLGLVQRLLHEGLEVPKEGGRMHHQLPGRVTLQGTEQPGRAFQNLLCPPTPHPMKADRLWPASQPKCTLSPHSSLGRGWHTGLTGKQDIPGLPSWDWALGPHTQYMIPRLCPGPRTSDKPQNKHMSLHSPQNRATSPRPGWVLLKPGSLSSAGVLSQGPAPPQPQHPHRPQAGEQHLAPCHSPPQLCPSGSAGGARTSAHDG